MDNEITIDPEEIRKQPDNSISSPKIIREIALYEIKTGDSSLNCKIEKNFTIAGLYPYVMQFFNIKPNEIK